MAEQTHIDSRLKKFIETHAADMIKEHQDIGKDFTDDWPSLANISEGAMYEGRRAQNPYMAAGSMLLDDVVYGKSLVTEVEKVGKAIVDDQKKCLALFVQVKEYLENSREILTKSQGEAMSAIGATNTLYDSSDVDD